LGAPPKRTGTAPVADLMPEPDFSGLSIEQMVKSYCAYIAQAPEAKLVVAGTDKPTKEPAKPAPKGGPPQGGPKGDLSGASPKKPADKAPASTAAAKLSKQLQEHKKKERGPLVEAVKKKAISAEGFVEESFCTVPSTGEIQPLLQEVRSRMMKLQVDVDLLDAMVRKDASQDEQNALTLGRSALDKLSKRQAYLADYAKKNPFTKKQAFVAKKLDVDAAVLVLESYQAELRNSTTDEDKKKVKALEAAKSQLQGRLQAINKEMNSDTADEHVDNPDELLGPAGPLYEAHGVMGMAKRRKGKIQEKRPDKPERKKIAGQLMSADLNQVPLTSTAITENDVMRKFLVATLEQAGFDGIDSKAVNRRQRKQHVKARNQQEWPTVDRKFFFRDKNGKQVECNSEMTPASKLGPTFDDLQGGGVCSHDTTSTLHATALCKTEVKVGGKTVFAGLRHGVNSARGIKEAALATMPDPELKEKVKEALLQGDFLSSAEFKDYQPSTTKDKSADQYLDRVVAGLKNDKDFRSKAAKVMKKNANVNRAKDMVKAAALMDPQKLDQAIQLGKPMKIQMTSVGLQTAGIGGETDMIADQREAWGAISNRTFPLKIKRRVNKNGKDVIEEVTVQVEVEVNSFSFGVNSPAFGFGKDMKGQLGWKDSDENVDRPMKSLIGEKTQRGQGGQVAAWVTDAEGKLKLLQQELPSPKRPQDVIKKESDELAKEIVLVKALATDVYEMWASEEYRTEGEAPYRMPARVAVLAQKLGQTPCFNCKSGKDRTSMMDVECKLLSTQMAVDGDLPPRNPEHNEKEKANRADVTMNSGSFEVQQMNAGHMGYKLGNLRGFEKETEKDAKGTSKQTDAISAG
jgi:hypothetical protein